MGRYASSHPSYLNASVRARSKAVPLVPPASESTSLNGRPERHHLHPARKQGLCIMLKAIMLKKQVYTYLEGSLQGYRRGDPSASSLAPTTNQLTMRHNSMTEEPILVYLTVQLRDSLHAMVGCL